jgi:hypothetical protein
VIPEKKFLAVGGFHYILPVLYRDFNGRRRGVLVIFEGNTQFIQFLIKQRISVHGNLNILKQLLFLFY